MRQDPRPPELAPPTVINAPDYADPPAGYANLPPLLRALLGALEQRWNGSILIHDACGNQSSVLRCERGYIVAGRAEGATELFQAVLAMCSGHEHMQFAFATNQDEVRPGPGQLLGRVDAWALTAAVVRGGDADVCVTEGVDFIGPREIIMRARVAFARFEFSVRERSVVDIIDSRPLTLLELELQSGLPREMIARVVFALWIARAVALAPAALRTTSGPVSHRAPAYGRVPRRDDEPTLIVAVDSRGDAVGRDREHAPAHGAREPRNWMPTTRPSDPPALHVSPQAIAARHFELAAFLLERGYAREAVFQAQKALRLCEPSPAQEALYAWALYQRSGAGSRIAQHVWDHLENALQADPSCESARYYHTLLLQQLQRT